MTASFPSLPGQRAVCLLTLATLAACGGRTSTLIDDNEPSLGISQPSNSAGAAAGGSTSTSPAGPSTAGASTAPATGTGGVSSAPAGGASSVAGRTPTGVGGSPAAAQACSDFCDKVQSSSCSGEFGAAVDCSNQCTDSLSGACIALGKAALACYLPIFTASAGHCSSVSLQAAKKCGAQVQAFQDCKDANDPMPAPPPGVSCGTSGSATQMTCNVTSSCTDGSFYVVNCKQTGVAQSVCSCASAGGTDTQFMFNEGVANACTDAAASCGAPTTP